MKKFGPVGTVSEGARNAVNTCMGLKKGEHVLIVTDRPTLKVGDALRKESEKITTRANVKLLVLEDLASRPLADLPEEVSESIPWAQVTFWAARSRPGELGARGRFIREAKRNARHGHMPDITESLMTQGMCADYDEVYELTHKIQAMATKAKEITVSNRFGVKLMAEFKKSLRWVPSDGRYHEKGKWGNLPEGETFTCPYKVNGRLVTNLLGDWFTKRYGNFKDALSFSVEGSFIKLESIDCGNADLKRDITKYLTTDANSSKAGEFALPTNPLLISRPTVGNLLQDEKARVHIAFGYPYPDETGAKWESKTHVDALLEECDVAFDGQKVMERGKYVV